MFWLPVSTNIFRLDTRRRVWAGFWRLADPKISLASFASIFLGASAAVRAGALDFVWLALTVFGIFCVEVAKNASGEIFDCASGNDLAVQAQDRSPFSGGKRVIVDHLLTPRETAIIAGFAYAFGIGIGLLIVALREFDVLWFGVLGIALAFFYHAPPFKLSYRGLGELAVGAAYGPMIASGTYLVQRGTVAREIIWLSIPLGLLIAAFLWINEFPDYAADKQVGKQTLVVRLGRVRASQVFALIIAGAYVMLACAPFWNIPLTVWFGALSLPFAIRATLNLLQHPQDTALIIPAQGMTLLAFVLFALSVGIGLMLSR